MRRGPGALDSVDDADTDYAESAREFCMPRPIRRAWPIGTGAPTASRA